MPAPTPAPPSTVVLCQTDIVWENKAANHEKVSTLLAQSAPPPRSLIVLPEMFATGFSMEVKRVREEHPAETESYLASLARQYDSYVVGGVVNAAGSGRGRNEAVIFSPMGKLMGRYAKIHPFGIGQDNESMHYNGGEEIVSFAWENVTVCPFICYDLRFPEVFRLGLNKGAHVFVVIANWPEVRIGHWVTLLRARAIENQAYVVAVNRCGQDPKNIYPGRSMIVDPMGDIIVELGAAEAVAKFEISMERLLTWRLDFPALNDRKRGYGL